MTDPDDPWYIRFPDGRIHRAANTELVRQHLGTGRIPLASVVRRSVEEEWTALEWTSEFADLVGRLIDHPTPSGTRLERKLDPGVHAMGGLPAPAPAAAVSSRLDPERLQTVGVVGWAQELLAALDSVLVRKKLLTAALTGLALGALLALHLAGLRDLEVMGYAIGGPLFGVSVLLVMAIGIGLLNKLSYVELAQLRPPRWREGLAGLGDLTCRLILVYLVVLLVVLVVVGGLLAFSYILLAGANPDAMRWPEAVALAAGILALLGAVLLPPLFCVSLLLGPILVVERCSALQALGHWGRLLWRNLGRVLANEILAFGLGVLVTLPFVLPVLGLSWFPLPERLARPAGITRQILIGLALAPLLAYLTVANLFIYLNLRYGSRGGRKP